MARKAARERGKGRARRVGQARSEERVRVTLSILVAPVIVGIVVAILVERRVVHEPVPRGRGQIAVVWWRGRVGVLVLVGAALHFISVQGKVRRWGVGG